ncbi:MAG: pyroglutamyl-peptidase I family protein [Alphaproteobacteria bacterium]
MRILLTGFGPFPGAPANPTADLVPALTALCLQEFPAADFHGEVLPVEYARAPDRVAVLHEQNQPDIALHFGLNGTASALHLERQAVNQCAIDQPDAAGYCPRGPILDTAEPGMRTCDWPAGIVERLRQAGYSAACSDSAGAYVCNAVMMRSLACAQARNEAFAGLVHVPHTRESVELCGPHREQAEARMSDADLLGSAALIVRVLIEARD